MRMTLLQNLQPRLKALSFLAHFFLKPICANIIRTFHHYVFVCHHLEYVALYITLQPQCYPKLEATSPARTLPLSPGDELPVTGLPQTPSSPSLSVATMRLVVVSLDSQASKNIPKSRRGPYVWHCSYHNWDPLHRYPRDLADRVLRQVYRPSVV